MNNKINKRRFAMDSIISRLAFALSLSVLISVLLAQAISYGNTQNFNTPEPVTFILSTH